MKALLFDLDGTLTQTFYADDQSYLKALSNQLSIDPNYPYWKECPHLTDEYVLHHFYQLRHGRKASSLERKRMQEDFLLELQTKQAVEPRFFLPIPGAIDFITRLLQTSNTIGIATGGWKHIAEYKLEIAGFPNDIPLIGSDDHPTKKGFLFALYQEVCDNTPIGDCIYIGDSPYDYKAAKELGMQFIGLDFKQRGIFDSMPVDHVFHDFTDTNSWMEILSPSS